MKKSFAIILLLVISSCQFLEEKMCGEISSFETLVLDSLNKKYNEVSISAIPCYPSHLNVFVKGENVPDNTLKELNIEVNVVNQKYGFGWVILVVFDNNDQFLFEQSYKNGKLIRVRTNSL